MHLTQHLDRALVVVAVLPSPSTDRPRRLTSRSTYFLFLLEIVIKVVTEINIDIYIDILGIKTKAT